MTKYVFLNMIYCIILIQDRDERHSKQAKQTRLRETL